MLYKLVEEGYYLPILKVLGNVTPLLFDVAYYKMIMNEQRYYIYIYLKSRKF